MTFDDTDADRLRRSRAEVVATIAEACARAGRDPGGVTLVAVSKTVPAERLRAAVAAGLTIFGENRVQEAEARVAAVPGAAWHLIGPLQSNKARRALATFDTIQSIDSTDLAVRLDRLAGEIRPNGAVPVLLQVNVDEDPAKAGFRPALLDESMESILSLPRLAVGGLMTIGRSVQTADEARPTFRALRMLSERLRARHRGLGPALSMGMSADYAVAVEEGATIVRVGRAIFGERP